MYSILGELVMKDISIKRAIITGATGGLGRNLGEFLIKKLGSFRFWS